ncbi:MAG TPA: DUF6266 family protein [Pelobium sp.]|nr:DUF6266 family protein [Pelobium sp.]
MAIIKNGINGGFSGKVGNVVGSTWRGLEIIRSKPRPPQKFSEKQLANQLKMKLVQLFLKKMVEVVRIGFRDETIIPTAFNSALSYNKKNAITGDYPDLLLDYSLVRLAQGEVYVPENLSLSQDDAGIHLEWDATIKENARRDDQLLLVIWDEETSTCEYSLQAYRSNAKFSFLPQQLKAGMHIWAAFIRHDRSQQSNSVYLGVTV